MALRSPSDNDKVGKESARRLAANLWEINGLNSPKNGGEKSENFLGEDHGRIDKSMELFEAELGYTHLLNHSHSPVSKNKDRSKQAGHRRKSSAISQKHQLTEYIGAKEDMDSVINGFEVAPNASIKTRLKEVSSSLSGSKEIIKALFKLLSQEGQNSSSRLTLISALRVEIDRARHEMDQLINQELNNEKEYTKTLLKRFAAEKVAWKRSEQNRVIDAISSVSRELKIEKKLRRQSERLSKRLEKELADSKAEYSRVIKKFECEKRAREIREKNAAIERLRTDLEVCLGAKQIFSNGDDNFVNLFGKVECGSCQNGERGKQSEEDSDDSELNSIELSVDSLSRSYKWSFVKDDDCMRDPVDEVFKGRRSLSEKIQWENICLQRKTSDRLVTEWNCNSNSKLGNGFDRGRLGEVCVEDEKCDHKPIKEKDVILDHNL